MVANQGPPDHRHGQGDITHEPRSDGIELSAAFESTVFSAVGTVASMRSTNVAEPVRTGQAKDNVTERHEDAGGERGEQGCEP